MELTDIEAFIKQQKDRDKAIVRLWARVNALVATAIALREEIAGLTGETATVVASKATKKRADIVLTPQRIIAVQEAVRDILDRTPGHIFTPSELVGATHLGRQTIAAVFRHLGFSEKRGKFTAPTQGEDHADVTH